MNDARLNSIQILHQGFFSLAHHPFFDIQQDCKRPIHKPKIARGTGRPFVSLLNLPPWANGSVDEPVTTLQTVIRLFHYSTYIINLSLLPVNLSLLSPVFLLVYLLHFLLCRLVRLYPKLPFGKTTSNKLPLPCNTRLKSLSPSFLFSNFFQCSSCL